MASHIANDTVAPSLHYEISHLWNGDLILQTPGVNSINILCTYFLYEHRFGSFLYVHVTREKLAKQRSFEKCVRKMLMKLTPDHRINAQITLQSKKTV
jgi:hypothetical protein